MLRAAAKNHDGVAVVVDPADYQKVISELKKNGVVPQTMRFELARKVFAHTAAYDGAIANYLFALDERKKRREYPHVLGLQVSQLQDPRYGENAHHSPALYCYRPPVAGRHGRV